jgi:hypothetical protein
VSYEKGAECRIKYFGDFTSWKKRERGRIQIRKRSYDRIWNMDALKSGCPDYLAHGLIILQRFMGVCK